MFSTPLLKVFVNPVFRKVGKAKETCEKLKKIDKTVFTIYMYADTPTCLMNDTLCKIYNLVDCPTWDY